MTTIQIAEAFVAIRPDSKGFKAEVERDVETPLKNVKSLVAGLAVGAAAISFVKGGLDELKEQQQVAAKLEATLKATGNAANVTKDQLDDMASSLQDLSGKDAEAIQSGQAVLLQFREVRNEVGEGNDIFDRASKAAVDLSVAMGTDMTSAFQTLGRALQDPLQGMRALRAANVILDDAQKATLKSLVDSGDKVAAQKFILDQLERQVGGVAEAYGQTLPGKLERSKNALDDLKASVVGSAAPALESLATVGTKAADAFSGLPAPVQTGVLLFGALAVAAKPATTALEGARTVMAGMRAAFDKAAVGAFDLAGNLPRLATGIGLAAGAATAATLVFANWKAGQDDAAAKAKELTDSLDQQTGALTENARATLLKQLRDRDQVGTLADAKVSFDDYSAAIESGTQLLDRQTVSEYNLKGYKEVLIGKLREEGGARNELLARLVEEGQLTGPLIDLIYGQAAAYDQNKKFLGDKAKVGADNNKVTEDEAKNTQAVTDAYKRQQDALDKLAAAKKNQYSAIVSLGSDASAFEAAKAGVDQARAKVAAMSPGDPGYAAAVKELSDAIEKQAQARVKVAETQAKVNGVELAAGEAARLHREELEKLSAGMPKVQEALAPMVALLDNLAKDRTANVHVQVSGVDELMAQLYKAQYELELMRKEAAGMSVEEAFATTPWPGAAPRASGGEVRAGRPYWVGEHGAEPFVPTEDGVILPAGSSMGGASIYAPVTIYGHDYSLDEAGRQFSTRIGELVGGAQR